ncbi:MAG TPA: glycosidase [Armatimonadota bacterium]
MSDTLKMQRSAQNPILAPTERWWENAFVFNPAVVEFNGAVHMLYRAHGDDHISRLGHAVSADGIHFERDPYPCLEGAVDEPLERLGVEDARAVALNGWVYATFTAASVEPVCPPHARCDLDATPWRVRVAMARTQDFRTWERLGVVIPEYNSKNAVLFPRKIGGRYAMLHRVAPDVWIAFSDDLQTWDSHAVVMSPRSEGWDTKRIGAGPPPIETDAGWLLFYHGIDAGNTYRASAALLDKENPHKVLARLDDWLIQPEQEFEHHGWVGNVVFPTGCIERDGQFRLYYGGADKVICTCTIPKADVEAALIGRIAKS